MYWGSCMVSVNQYRAGLPVFWWNYFVLNQNNLKHMLDTKQEKMQVVGTIWACKGKKTLKGFFAEALNGALNTL